MTCGAGIRDFVERDSASLRGDGDSGLAANTAVTLVQRIRSTSVQEIDGLLAELQTMRALPQKEGERVQPNTRICANRPSSRRRSSLTDSTNSGSPHLILCLKPHPQTKEDDSPGVGRAKRKGLLKERQIGTERAGERFPAQRESND
jgi:hypothetical protein